MSDTQLLLAREQMDHIDRMLSNSGVSDDYPSDAIYAVLNSIEPTEPGEAP